MGQVYFFNMTADSSTVSLNESSAESLSAISNTSPYSPGMSSNTYQREQTDNPSPGVFGEENTIQWKPGSQKPNSVTVNCNFEDYPDFQNFYVYLFLSTAIVMPADQDESFWAQNGGTINVAFSSESKMGG